MKFRSLFLTFFIGVTLFAQNPVGFDKMAKDMAGNKSLVINRSQVLKKQEANQKIIFLDTRELNEYKTSHLPGAIWVGSEKIDWTKIDKLDKNSIIVVYCSVGYRSGELTTTLSKKGFKNVKNLYGGLFNWANNGGTLYNSLNQTTKNVHGFDKEWSKWLNPERVTIVL